VVVFRTDSEIICIVSHPVLQFPTIQAGRAKNTETQFSAVIRADFRDVPSTLQVTCVDRIDKTRPRIRREISQRAPKALAAAQRHGLLWRAPKRYMDREWQVRIYRRGTVCKYHAALERFRRQTQ